MAGVAFVAIKVNIRVAGKQDIQAKVMITLFAEVECDLISERMHEGLRQECRAPEKDAGAAERTNSLPLNPTPTRMAA